MDAHPKNHYQFCPRCSKEGSFNETNFSFKCHSCGFHFFLNSSAAVTALIFDDRNRLLFTRRGIEPAYGKLDLPGGFVDPNESAESALLREIKEELDVVPEKVTYYGSFPNQYHFSGTIVYTTDLVFRCKVNNVAKIKVLDDIIGIEFIALENIEIEELPFVSVQNIIKELKNE